METKLPQNSDFSILKKMEAELYGKERASMRNQTTIDFQLIHPVTTKVVRNLKLVTEHVGDLMVTGTAYHKGESYTVDIDFVKWNGSDVKDLLCATGYLDEVQENCERIAPKLFENFKTPAA